MTQPDKNKAALPPAIATTAVDMVDYRVGAVVSRQILQKGTGNVTLFAFEQGEGLSEHTAPFDALVHVLEGDADITIGGTPYRTCAGQMILMPAGISHALSAVTRFKMMLVMIRS